MYVKVKTLEGFTLIELVVVIVILGILAATAAPKFIDLSSDAKIAVIKNTEGAINSAVKMLHMTAQIQGQLGSDVTVQTSLGDYQYHNGYPENKSESTTPNLFFVETFMDLGEPKNIVKTNTNRKADYGELSSYEVNLLSRIGYGTGDLSAGNCYAYYIHTSTSQEVGVELSGC